jgi:hypothetical protein
MTSPKATPRSRQRSLKTWSAFGNLGRRPTEYEILTHNLNHTTGPIPLEMGPEVHGNVWLREHRDAIKLTVGNWDDFRDPDAMTYGKYVASQDDQETYVEGLLEQFDHQGYDASLSTVALELLKRAFTPTRYLVHGEQMLSAYVQQLAISSYISNCAAFQAADQLRRVQLTAYRTTQLQLTHETAGFATTERQSWETADAWQPIRRAVESALVEYDWDRAFVVTNLVVKPVADLLFLDQLSTECAAVGASLDSLILKNLWLDSLRSQRWTIALVTFLTGADDGNAQVLQAYLDEFAPLAREMIAAGSTLLSTGQGRSPEVIGNAAMVDWITFLEGAGLKLSSDLAGASSPAGHAPSAP